jgi:branched-chain amino acid transport system ATP-binding protein
MNSLLRIQQISKSFGGVHALDQVTLEVSKNQVALMIGPNGSGKTTLINVISGVFPPDSGSIFLNDVDITGEPPHRIYKLGLARTFQIPALFGKLTVLENLMVAYSRNAGEGFLRAPFKGTWMRDERNTLDRAVNILQILNLETVWDTQASKLSGGQMKLLEIGRVLMSDAKMILLDEPISGVNPTLAHEIFTHILRLRKDLGITFLIVEHRLEVAVPYVDYVYALSWGKLITEGKATEVLEDKRVVDAYLGG